MSLNGTGELAKRKWCIEKVLLVQVLLLVCSSQVVWTCAKKPYCHCHVLPLISDVLTHHSQVPPSVAPGAWHQLARAGRGRTCEQPETSTKWCISADFKTFRLLYITIRWIQDESLRHIDYSTAQMKSPTSASLLRLITFQASGWHHLPNLHNHSAVSRFLAPWHGQVSKWPWLGSGHEKNMSSKCEFETLVVHLMIWFHALQPLLKGTNKLYFHQWLGIQSPGMAARWHVQRHTICGTRFEDRSEKEEF